MSLKKVSRKEFDKYLKDYEGQVTKSHDMGESATDTYRDDAKGSDGVIARVDLSGDGKDDQYFIAE